MSSPNEPRAPAAAAAPRVMLVSLWCTPDAAWHARLVDADARVHEFSSPFELARFLARPELPAGDATPSGLR